MYFDDFSFEIKGIQYFFIIVHWTDVRVIFIFNIRSFVTWNRTSIFLDIKTIKLFVNFQIKSTSTKLFLLIHKKLNVEIKFKIPYL